MYELYKEIGLFSLQLFYRCKGIELVFMSVEGIIFPYEE